MHSSQSPRSKAFSTSLGQTARLADLSTAESSLCGASKLVSQALVEIASNAEAARTMLEAHKLKVITAVAERFDDLLSEVERSRTHKVAALEAELVTIDAMLDRVQSACSAGREWRASEHKSEDQAQVLTMLDDTEEMLSRAPMWPVEPSGIEVTGLAAEVPRLVSNIGRLGKVVAAQAPCAEDVVITGLSKHISPGAVYSFSLSYRDEYVLAHSVDRCAELSSREVRTVPPTCVLPPQPPVRITASIVVLPAPAGANPGIEPADSAIDTVCRLPVSFQSAPRGASVAIGPLPSADELPERADLIIGARVNGAEVRGFPASVRIVKPADMASLIAPNVITTGFMFKPGVVVSPTISGAGVLWVPVDNARQIAAFTAEGTRFLERSDEMLAGSFCSIYTRVAAFDAVSGTLFVGDANGRDSKLVALDASTLTRRWETAPRDINVCAGATVIAGRDLVAASSSCGNRVFIYDIETGSKIAYFNCKVPGYLASWTCDGSSTVFVSSTSRTGSEYLVTTFRVRARSTSTGEALVETLGSAAALAALPASSRPRLLAVVPRRLGSIQGPPAQLVVGSIGSPALHVFSLPDCSLLGTFRLEGMHPVGLAGDPAGGALAICDSASGSIHVFPWPMSGLLTS